MERNAEEQKTWDRLVKAEIELEKLLIADGSKVAYAKTEGAYYFVDKGMLYCTGDQIRFAEDIPKFLNESALHRSEYVGMGEDDMNIVADQVEAFLQNPIISYATPAEFNPKHAVDLMMNAFWEEYRKAFPEVVTGDSYLSDDDVEAGMELWLLNNGLITRIEYEVPQVLPMLDDATVKARVKPMVAQGLEAARQALRNGTGISIQEPSPVIFKHYENCIDQVLSMNFPGQENEAAYFGAPK